MEEKQSVPALPAPQGDLLLIRGLEKKRQRLTLTHKQMSHFWQTSSSNLSVDLSEDPWKRD